MRAAHLFLLLPFLSGCLAYGYLSICRTPAVSVPEDNVRAFRVDWDEEHSGYALNCPNCRYEVSEIEVLAGSVSAQNDAYFCYGSLFYPGFIWARTRDMSLLLYRPGFETVELAEQPLLKLVWPNLAEKVAWKEAPTLMAQEESLKRVLTPSSHVNGVISEISLDRNSLQFAAREYARLAASSLALAPEMAETRSRLLRKAEEYADQLRHTKP